MRHIPHNAQTILDLSDDEEYLYTKQAIKDCSELTDKLEENLLRLKYDYMPKKKKIKRAVINNLRKAERIISKAHRLLDDKRYDLEKEIIQAMLNRPIAPRKVDNLGPQEMALDDVPEELCMPSFPFMGSTRRNNRINDEAI